MILKGKRGLICGVANDRSIAWGIAKAAHEHGAEILFSYQGEILERKVKALADSIGSTFVEPCDASSDESIKLLFDKVSEKYGKIDFIVHAIAFANKEYLKNEYYNVPKADFLQAMDISVYSLTSMCRQAERILNDNSSIITLTYHGSQKVMPNYNVMGIAKAALECSVMYLANDMGKRGVRVNSISAGPARTLASAGISDFKKMLQDNQLNSPLKRNVSLEDVGGTAVYLLSNLSSGVTGENIYVDCGYNIIGAKKDENEGI